VSPLDELTAPAFDLHLGREETGGATVDCTHWCYAPGLAEGVASILLEVMRGDVR